MLGQRLAGGTVLPWSLFTFSPPRRQAHLPTRLLGLQMTLYKTLTFASSASPESS